MIHNMNANPIRDCTICITALDKSFDNMNGGEERGLRVVLKEVGLLVVRSASDGPQSSHASGTLFRLFE